MSASIDFYTLHLGFILEFRLCAEFAIVTKGALRLLLTAPSFGGGVIGAGEQRPAPGGWNRIQVAVLDAAAMQVALQRAGQKMRGELIEGKAGRHLLLEDPSGNLVELYEAFHD